MNGVIVGRILEVVGVFILTMVAITNYPHQRVYGQPINKRYWWMGWNPIFKINPPSGKAKWMIKWKHKVVRYGFIPPKHQWDIIGFLFILIGFSLQLKFYLN